MTFLTLLLKWHFSPPAQNALRAAESSNRRFTRGASPRRRCAFRGKLSPELGENWVHYWEVYSQNSSPEVLNFTRAAPAKYYYSLQTFIVLKRGSPSTGIQRAQTLTTPIEDLRGLVSHRTKGLHRVPFQWGPLCPRAKIPKPLLLLGASPASTSRRRA